MKKKGLIFAVATLALLLYFRPLPFPELSFEDAVALYAENVRIAAESGADLILIETMNDAYETKILQERGLLPKSKN